MGQHARTGHRHSHTHTNTYTTAGVFSDINSQFFRGEVFFLSPVLQVRTACDDKAKLCDGNTLSGELRYIGPGYAAAKPQCTTTAYGRKIVGCQSCISQLQCGLCKFISLLQVSGASKSLLPTPEPCFKTLKGGSSRIGLPVF